MNRFQLVILMLTGTLAATATIAAPITLVDDERRQIIEFHQAERLHYTRLTLFQDQAGGRPLTLYLEPKNVHRNAHCFLTPDRSAGFDDPFL